MEGNAGKAPCGLFYGITPWHLRILCDDPWEGGRGQSLESVEKMTLDQVLMLLTDRKLLQRRQRTVPAAMVAAIAAGPGGVIKGRAADGTPIQGKIGGKSLARQLMEAQEAEKKAGKKATKISKPPGS